MSAGGSSKCLASVPTGLTVSRGVVAGRVVVVFAFPSDDADNDTRIARLTPAERDVVRLVLLGCTNTRIAELRSTSIRTVSKQVESAYRRLNVRSRCELAALLA